MKHFPSFPYVPRFSMVILNELFARPSLTDFVSNNLCRQSRPRSAVCDEATPESSFPRWAKVSGLGFYIRTEYKRVLLS